jgi:hypothetical protein
VDLDGDGHKDILSGSWPGEFYFFKRRPNGTYSAPETLKFRGGRPINIGRASAVAVADWNGNGLPDLILGNIDGQVFLVVNEGTARRPVFVKAEPLRAANGPVTAGGKYAGPFVADWDGDGLADLLVGGGDGSVQFYRNNGDSKQPELEAPVTLISAAPLEELSRNLDNPPRSATRVKVSVADWNGDGLPDLIVGDFISSQAGGERRLHGWVWVYLRKSQGAGTASIR